MRGCVERRVAVVPSLLMRLRVRRGPVVRHRLRRRKRLLLLRRRRLSRPGRPAVPAGHSGVAVLAPGRRNVLALALLFRATPITTWPIKR